MLLSLVLLGAGNMANTANAQFSSSPPAPREAQTSKIPPQAQQASSEQPGAQPRGMAPTINTPTSTPTCPPIYYRISGEPGKAGPATIPAGSHSNITASKSTPPVSAHNADLPDGPAEFGVDDGTVEGRVGFQYTSSGTENAGVFMTRFR